MDYQFAKDVMEGLNSIPKTLPSKYFYDAKGDSLFIEIMKLPEYYLSRAELEIFSQQSRELIQSLNISHSQHFELIELGAGDGSKTLEILRVLLEQGFDFTYIPIDISNHVLRVLSDKLTSELPELKIRAERGDYFEKLNDLKQSKQAKVIFFLGSNIGNMSDEQASQFIYNLGANLNQGDNLVLGVDLIKPSYIVLPAYDDAAGITREFNLNLLVRMNRELGASFDITKFTHIPEYDENQGVARSYLQSTVDQTVSFPELGESIAFSKGERILVEISRKYSTQIIESIIEPTDFSIVDVLTDTDKLFADYIFKKN